MAFGLVLSSARGDGAHGWRRDRFWMSPSVGTSRAAGRRRVSYKWSPLADRRHVKPRRVCATREARTKCFAVGNLFPAGSRREACHDSRKKFQLSTWRCCYERYDPTDSDISSVRQFGFRGQSLSLCNRRCLATGNNQETDCAGAHYGNSTRNHG